MGRKYAFKGHDRPYFVAFIVIHWLDVYIREIYRHIFYDSVSFCQREKGLEAYAYERETVELNWFLLNERDALMKVVIVEHYN